MDDFDRIINQAKGIVGASTSMATAAFPNGATLVCRCGVQRPASTAECARYLSLGWPTHCGRTMEARANG